MGVSPRREEKSISGELRRKNDLGLPILRGNMCELEVAVWLLWVAEISSTERRKPKSAQRALG